jgi:hypothetical protein
LCVNGLSFVLIVGVGYSRLGEIGKPSSFPASKYGGDTSQSNDSSVDKINAISFKVYVSGSIIMLGGIVISGFGAGFPVIRSLDI